MYGVTLSITHVTRHDPPLFAALEKNQPATGKWETNLIGGRCTQPVGAHVFQQKCGFMQLIHLSRVRTD